MLKNPSMPKLNSVPITSLTRSNSFHFYIHRRVSRFLDIVAVVLYCCRWIMAGLLWKKHLMDRWKRRFTGEFSVLLRNFLSHYCSSSWNWLSFCRLGLWLLSRVKPSEIFLKSISKEVTGVEIVYPSRLVFNHIMCCSVWILVLLWTNFLFR